MQEIIQKAHPKWRLGMFMFFFFEIECNNYVCDTHLLCPWDVFYTFTKIWVNISLFHGVYEARKWKKSSKNHIFQKKFNFFFLISFSRYIFSTFQTISSHLGPISGDIFLKSFTVNFFLSKVTLVHVHAFLSLKLNAMIIFEIHIYSVP